MGTGTERSGDASGAQAVGAAAAASIRWDDSNLRSSYANVVHVTGTREEIVLLFGIHQAWHAGQKEVAIQLLERVMLNPFAAKRLHLMLGNVLREFEARYGPLKTDAAQTGPGESLSSR